MASMMNGNNGSDKTSPTEEITIERIRRTRMKVLLRRNPSPKTNQPGGGLLDFDSAHAQGEKFLHRNGAAAIGRGNDDAMHFLFLDDVHEVSGHGLAGDRAFHFAGPTGDLDADLWILPQAKNHALRPLSCAEDVDALDKNGQLHEPSESQPPTEESDGEDDEADFRGAAS
jgi:hypothetical protein